MKAPQTISLLGAGYLGLHFAKSLKESSYELKLSTTKNEKKHRLAQEGFKSFLYRLGDEGQESFLNSDYLFILTPPSQEVLEGLKKLNVKDFSNTKIIYTSSIGIYDSEAKVFPENLSLSPQTKRQELLLEIEKTVASFPHSMIIRLGGLISKDRHPARALSHHKKISDGKTPINLSHLDDVLNLFHCILKDFQAGIYHFVSEAHPSKKDFYGQECQRLKLATPLFENAGNPDRIIRSNKIKEVYHFELFSRF